MCEFASWVEKDDKVYFLTANQVFNTTRGKALQKYCGNSDDYVGHGAIRQYYNLKDGTNRECTDFSTPDNFPIEIADAIKGGKFRGITVVKELLTQPALAEYNKITQPACAEYNKIQQPALAEYKKIRKIRQSALAEYEKIQQAAFWDLFAIPENRNPNWR